MRWALETYQLVNLGKLKQTWLIKESAGTKYAIKKDKKGMVYVVNSNIESVNNVDELQAVFGMWILETQFFCAFLNTNRKSVQDRGATNRKVSSTKMNAESSRSHLILSILLEVTNKTTGAVNKGNTCGAAVLCCVCMF